MTMTLRRRTAASAAMLLSAALVLAACGSGDESSDDPAGGSTAGYPISIDTAWGELTLDEKPERIVVLDAAAVDALASIGETPVAFSSGGITDEQALLDDHPWLEGRFESEQFDPSMAIAAFEISAEAVAAHEPDLIIGSIWNLPEEQHEQFSQIAPTYVGRETDASTFWEDRLTDIGALTGKSDEAAQVLADVDAEFEAGSELLSGLQGKTYADLAYYPDMTEFRINDMTWQERLGLVPAEFGLSGAEPLSQENMEQLTADILFIGSAPAAGWRDPEETQATLEADPRFAGLPASQNDAVIYPDTQTVTAGYTNRGPLATLWLIEHMTPQLESLALNQEG